jgi:hypothetical protein
MYASRGLASLNYMDSKQILDRKAVENKRGTLTTMEIKLLVNKIHDRWEESKLKLGMRDREMAAMQKNQTIQRGTTMRFTTGQGRRDH